MFEVNFEVKSFFSFSHFYQTTNKRKRERIEIEYGLSVSVIGILYWLVTSRPIILIPHIDIFV